MEPGNYPNAEIFSDTEKYLQSVKDPHGLPFRPLYLWLPAPRRRALGELPGGRRPIVAILDTGVGEHPWFDAGVRADPIVLDATKEQSAWSVCGAQQPWHGTFVAGLIRQNAPDARILSIPLARDTDGGVVAGQLESGLGWLTDWMAASGGYADVVCMAVGRRVVPVDDAVGADDDAYLNRLAAQIRELAARGCLVLAASGNLLYDGQGEPVQDGGKIYPGALAAYAEAVPIVTVGALKTNGSTWERGVDDSFVTHRYYGVDVLSTTPPHDMAALQAHDPTDTFGVQVIPGLAIPAEHGARFGRGSGTSYAVAGFAGLLAQAMVDAPGGVADTSAAAATARGQAALDEVGYRAD